MIMDYAISSNTMEPQLSLKKLKLNLSTMIIQEFYLMDGKMLHRLM